MRDKRSIAQVQLGEELVELKSQLVATRSLLAGMVKLLDRLVERLLEQGGLAADDAALALYREGLAEAKKLGLSLRTAAGSDRQVQCPSCRALLRGPADEQILRCPWCGHQFD